MYKIKAYKIYNDFDAGTYGVRQKISTALISPLGIKRNWLQQDKNVLNGPYQCQPLMLANGFGYSISFPVDIRVSNKNGKIKCIEGEEHFYNRDTHSTFSLDTNLSLITEKGVSTLVMPAPNSFINGIHLYTALIETSWWTGELQLVIRVDSDREEVLIPKNTPVASIIPIDLRQFNNCDLEFYNNALSVTDSRYKNVLHRSNEYSEACRFRASTERSKSFYARGTDHNNNIIGEHSIKKFTFKMNEINDFLEFNIKGDI